MEGGITKKGASVEKQHFYVRLERIENQDRELEKKQSQFIGFFLFWNNK
jgi:hypothetical protein